MGQNYTGLNANTVKNLLLDTGAFFVNFDVTTDTVETATAKCLGATSGGGEFSAKPNIRSVDVDGAKGKVKGLDFLESWEVTMKANLLELRKDILQNALLASKTSSTTINTKSYTKIEGKNVIEETDYIDNITYIGNLVGSTDPVIIQVFNALSTDGLNIKPKDNDDNIVELSVEGRYDVTTLDTPPFAIYYPTIA